MCTKGLGTQTDVLRVSGLHLLAHWRINPYIFLKTLNFGLQKMGPCHDDLLFGKCWDCWKFQLLCFWWGKRNLMFSTWLICTTFVLLSISEILGKRYSKPFNFLSEPKQTNRQKPHQKWKNSKPHQTPKPKLLSHPKNSPKTESPAKASKSHLLADCLSPNVLSSEMDVIILTAAITH